MPSQPSTVLRALAAVAALAVVALLPQIERIKYPIYEDYPHTQYKEGDRVDMLVNTMTSPTHLLPLDYYSLPFPRVSCASHPFS